VKKQSGDAPFAVADMVEFLGVNMGVFQQWMNRGIVPFSVAVRGGRTYRRFTFSHVNEIAIIGALHAQGIEPSVCKEIAKQITPLIDELELAQRHEALQRVGAYMGTADNIDLPGKSASERLAQLESQFANMPHPPEFPHVACVIGDGVYKCEMSDSIETALRKAKSAVCFVVDLPEICERVWRVRVKALAKALPSTSRALTEIL